MTSALDPARKIWHYGYSQWQDRDGLPQNTVQAIAQTADGYLWLGTEAGLVRFNGRTFHTFDTSNEPSFRSNSITALAAGGDGGLWVASRNGLLLYQGGRFRRFGTAEGLPNENVRALVHDESGALWVGTNGGVSRWEGTRFSAPWTARSGMVGNAVRALAKVDKDVWAGLGGGLNVIRTGKVMSSPIALPVDTVRAILQDRQGRTWIGTEASGLYAIEAGLTRRLTTADGLSSNSIRTLLEDRDANLWIGTVGGGLNRLRDGRIDRMTTAEGLNSDHVRALFEDREGSVWIGTEGGGLAQLRHGRAVTYSTTDGLRTGFIRAIGGDGNNTLWVGTEGGGLHRLQGDRIVPDGALGMPGAFVTALLRDTAGHLWVGTEGQGAMRLGPGGRRAFSTAGGLTDNSVWAIVEGPAGTVWLGSSNGLVRIRGAELRVFRTADGLRSNSIRALHAARDGSLWIALRGGGLQRWRPGGFEPVAGEGNPAVTSFLDDSGQGLWMTSTAGALHWDGSQMRAVTTRQGMFSDNLFQVLRDDGGRLWFSSSRGIFAVRETELRAAASGATERVQYTALTSADGMRSSECSGDAQPAGWRTRDGSLWFATIRGVVRVPPQAKVSPPPPPAVAIESVSVNGQPLDPRSAIVSPPGNRLFSVRFAALTYLAPEKTRYRYRLDGVDQDWIEATGRNEAVYHGVPPGAYLFRVGAAHADGAWNEQTASVPVRVEPFFYQTPWFFATGAVVLIGLVYAGHQARTAALRREFAAVLAERSRIAREIHDTLLQGFAGAALQLNAIAKRWNRNPEQAGERLEQVLEQIDGCLAEARHEIGELRRGPERAPSPLTERLRIVAEGAAAGSGVRIAVMAQGDTRPLPPDVEKNLLRITREAIANASRHARPNSISIHVEFGKTQVRLLARDDGDGMPPKPAAGEHYGILGMRERAESMGGTFVLRSEARHGTEIEVTLPLDGAA